MNIKQHIEAGHCTRDENFGGWTVLLRNNTTARVFTTKNGGQFPLVGVVSIAGRGWTAIQWTASGCPENNSSHWSIDHDILPPPPRKVEVKRWVLLSPRRTFDQGFTDSPEQADEWRRTERCPVVELTGSYEQPWS